MTGFYKLSGGGNDFLALAEPEQPPRSASIRAWCARGMSLGADGVFTLAREGEGAVRMIHYNADGGRTELCVNGARCAARLAFHLGWAEGEVEVRTDVADIGATDRSETTVSLTLAAPEPQPEPTTLELSEGPVHGHLLRVGGPHFVIDWPSSLAQAPVASQGPPLRSHDQLGDAGANVHWVRVLDPGHFGIRSFERGVEGETLACGSGVLATAAVGVFRGDLELPCEGFTGGGFVFRVSGSTADGRVTSWELEGDARLVARGELMPGSEAMLDPDPARQRELTSS